MGVLYYSFTSSSITAFNGAVNRGEIKKMVEKNSSLSGILSFSTDSSITQRSSACKLTSIMLIGTVGISKTTKYRDMTGNFSFSMLIEQNTGQIKKESVSISGSILGSPDIDVPEWKNISPVWTDNTLIHASIFGTSAKTCGLSITFQNPDSGFTAAALNCHMKDLRVAINYSGASYIKFRSDGSDLNETVYSEGSIPSYSGTLTKTGYTFGGWKSSRTGTVYGPGETLPAADDYDTIYDAEWNENTYTLKFDANGGSGDMDSQVLWYKQSTVNTPTEEFINPTNTIYYNSNGATQNFKTESVLTKTFKNYWIDDREKIFNVGDPINQERTGVTGDNVITLYAQWNDVGEILEKPFRQYHTFIGWKDQNNPDIIYPEGYNLILTEGNKYLEAQWKKTQPRIFFKENDNSTSLQRIIFTQLKDKKIKKIFIYTQDDNTLKEV